MDATSGFFQWWFEQWGIGGWVIFFLLTIVAIAWLIYDSQTRRIRAVGWLLGAILPGLLLLPSALFSLSSDLANQLQKSQELFFYLGLLGGIVPVVVAAGYFITYKDTRGCDKGHVYDASLAECPVCVQERARLVPPPPPPPPPVRQREEAPPPPPPSKPKAHAWLVEAGSGRSYQLNQGDTRIGRRKDNDVVITDTAVSREHVLIREEKNHFTLYDRGAKSGTLVNSQRLEKPLLLAHGDEIVIGDTRLQFVTSR